MYFTYLLGLLLSLPLYLSTTSAAEYSNALKTSHGGDPNIVWHHGWYYMMTTSGAPAVLRMTRARTLNGLKDGEMRDVYTDSEPSRAFNFWAPEMHRINDCWFIYYAAGPEACCEEQKSHVLEGGETPWDEFEYLGQVRQDYSVDGTLLDVDGGNYYVYSCRDKNNGNTQSICIAERYSPSKTGESFVISSPTEEWESRNSPLNEGPFALYRDGRTWLSFSASTCDSPTYALGLLEYVGNDPLSKSSWRKTGPVFSAANGNFGTGHNSFFTSPDGKEAWNVYHSVTNQNGSCGDDRQASAAVVRWNDDGTPNLGQPTPFGEVFPGPSGEDFSAGNFGQSVSVRRRTSWDF